MTFCSSDRRFEGRRTRHDWATRVRAFHDADGKERGESAEAAADTHPAFHEHAPRRDLSAINCYPNILFLLLLSNSFSSPARFQAGESYEQLRDSCQVVQFTLDHSF
jgi:hypothetical protein